MKKKIIFVSQALWLGGIETALVNLINHLDDEKYDITCLITEDYQDMAYNLTKNCRLLVADRQHTISFKKAYKYKKLFNIMEDPLTNSKFRRFVWKVFKKLFQALEMHLYAMYIKSNMKDEQFDVGIIYSDRVAEITIKAIKAKKYHMFYHNADIGKAYHDFWGYCFCDKIITVSEEQCKKLKRTRPKYAKKMIVINNYIDVETTRTKASLYTENIVFDEPGIHLVSCGRLAYQKGFDIAIKACSLLVQQGYDNLYWYVLGMGPDKKKLEKLIEECNIEKHFRLIGAQINPFGYMKEADLYVQPSRTEGYSLSILEARALACPIVATYGAGEEQLVDGETGTLCEATVESLVLAIKKHLDNSELSNTYVLNLKTYSFETENEKIIQKIESLL